MSALIKAERADEIGFKAFRPSAPEPPGPGSERMHSKIKYLKIHL